MRLRTNTRPDRRAVIDQTKQQALVDGKAIGTYTDKHTKLEERFIYVRREGRAELAEIWTNAEKIYPPFTDRKGRRIRY
jgi:hypothetical protein